MKNVFEFAGKTNWEINNIPAEIQSMIDAKAAEKSAIMDGEYTREEKKAAIVKFNQEVKWETKWETINGVEVPTAVLTIEQ